MNEVLQMESLNTEAAELSYWIQHTPSKLHMPFTLNASSGTSNLCSLDYEHAHKELHHAQHFKYTHVPGKQCSI